MVYFGHVNICASNNKFSIPHCNFNMYFKSFFFFEKKKDN